MTFHRFVALGDSFTEGVGDPDPTRPTVCAAGPTGWPRCWRRRTDDFGYANLAVRGRKLDGILAEQLETALALEPDLVTVYAGANDILRPRGRPRRAGRRYDEALGRLAATGARLLVWTAFDPGARRSTGRCVAGSRSTTSWCGRVADRHGATIVDFWRMRDYRDWRFWDTDRMHMGPAGHQRMAAAVLDGARRSDAVPAPELAEEAVLTPASGGAPTSTGPARSPSRGCTVASPAGRAATRSALGVRSSARSSNILTAAAGTGSHVRM